MKKKYHYLKKDEFSEIFDFTMKRYSSVYNTEYFSRTNQIGFLFYDRLFSHLNICNNHFKIHGQNFYKDYILKSLIYSHTHINHSVTSLKISGWFRYYWIANIYLVLLYEIYISYIIKIIQEIINKHQELKNFLVDKEYFWFIHQVDSNWTISYIDLWKKYDTLASNMAGTKKYFLEMDVKSYYDTISHEKLWALLLRFMKDFMSEESYITSDIDNFLADFHDILFKISKYNNIWIPQWLRGSDYLAILFLWLVFFYNRGDALNFNSKDNHYIINKNVFMLIYADDILFLWNKECDIAFASTYIAQLLYNYWLNINETKTTDIISTIQFNTKAIININKIRAGDFEEKKVLKNFIVQALLNRDASIIFSKEFKKYFKWLFKVDFEKPKEIKQIFGCIFWSSKLSDQKIGLYLFAISDKILGHLFTICYKYDKRVVKIMLNFLEKNEIYFSDNTLINIVRYFLNENWNCPKELKNKVLSIIEGRMNPVLNCFYQEIKKSRNKNKYFFDPYIYDTQLFGLEKLLYKSYHINKQSDFYQENIFWLKLHNLFWTDIDMIDIKKIKDLDSFKSDEAITFLHQMAEVVDSLILNKYRNSIFYMKNASFIADLFSLFNQLFTILISLENNKFTECNISFGDQFDLKYIKWPNKEKTFLKKYAILDEDRLFFFYLMKKRAFLNHKEKGNIIDSSILSYSIIKYENSEILLGSIKLVLEKICFLIKNYIR